MLRLQTNLIVNIGIARVEYGAFVIVETHYLCVCLRFNAGFRKGSEITSRTPGSHDFVSKTRIVTIVIGKVRTPTHDVNFILSR